MTVQPKTIIHIKMSQIEENNHVLHNFLSAFKNVKYLRKLMISISNSKIQQKEKQEFCKNIKHYTKLEALQIYFSTTIFDSSESLDFFLNPLQRLRNFKVFTLKSSQSNFSLDSLYFNKFCHNFQRLNLCNIKSLSLSLHDDNSTIDDSCLKILANVITDMKRLKSFSLELTGRYNEFTNDGIESILKVLKKLELQKLELIIWHSNLIIDDSSMIEFYKILSLMRSLKEIKLRIKHVQSRWTDFSLIRLGKTLAKLKNLKNIRSSFDEKHAISNSGFDNHILSLIELSQLQRIKIVIPNAVYVTDETFQNIARIFSTAIQLKSFKIQVKNGYFLKTSGLITFGIQLKHAKNLEKLSVKCLYGNKWFHNEHLPHLVYSCQQLPFLRSLCLRFFSAGGSFNDYCLSLISYLNFRAIDCFKIEINAGQQNQNNLTDIGFLHLLKSLSKSVILRKLVLKLIDCNIDISDKSFYSLSKVLLKHHKIERLCIDIKLQSFHKKSRGLEMLINAINSLKSLKELNWSLLLDENIKNYLRIIAPKIKNKIKLIHHRMILA